MGNNYVGYTDTKDPDLSGKNKYQSMIEFADRILKSIVGMTYGKESRPLKIKIGIHCGKILSSLMGYKKVQFCLFGPTMNQTSRIASSHFAENSILISNQVWQKIEKLCLPYFFNRIQMNVKGISETLTVYQISKIQKDHGHNIINKKIFRSEVSPDAFGINNGNQLRKPKRGMTLGLKDEKDSNRTVKAWKFYRETKMKESTLLNGSCDKNEISIDEDLDKKNSLKTDYLNGKSHETNYLSNLMNRTKKETQQNLIMIEVFLFFEFILKQSFKSDLQENNDFFSICFSMKMISLLIFFLNNFLIKKLYENCIYRILFILNSLVLVVCLVVETIFESDIKIQNLDLVETFFLVFFILAFPFFRRLELIIMNIVFFLVSFCCFYDLKEKLIEKLLIAIGSYMINIVKINIRHSFYQKSFEWSKKQLGENSENHFTNNSIDHLLPKHVRIIF